MKLTITKDDFVEAGGNAREFDREYREGEILPQAILNLVTERYRGYGFVRSVICKGEALEVDIR